MAVHWTARAKPLFIISLGFGSVFFPLFLRKNDTIFEAINISLMLSASIAVFLCVLFIIVNFTYLVTVFTSGILSYDPFGSWKCDFMKWDAMKKIKRKNIIGVKYFIIESEEAASRLWIPIELVNKDDFIRYIGENAGKNHPVFIELSKVCT